MNNPAIRFAGFTDDWEERKLGEIADIVRGASPRPINDPKWFDDGSDIGWLRISDVTEQNGRIQHLEQHLSKLGQEKTRILTEPHLLLSIAATVGKPVINYISTGVHDGFLIFQNPLFNREFMFQWLEMFRPNWQQYGQPGSQVNLNSDLVKNNRITLPGELEQKNVGKLFSDLDVVLDLHQREHDKTVNIKKALLEKMFPKDGEDKPEIRFAGFTDAWEQRKLGDVYSKIRNAFVGTATPYYVKEGHFYLESNNVKDGQINRNTEIFINDEFYERQKDNWLRTGDLVMVQSGHVGHTAIIPPELDNTAAHALIIIANPIQQINPYFLNYQFQTRQSRKKLSNITTGNTIKHILSSEIKKFCMELPCYDEQMHIGHIFINLDRLIALHKRELTKLQNIKKALLEKMFV